MARWFHALISICYNFSKLKNKIDNYKLSNYAQTGRTWGRGDKDNYSNYSSCLYDLRRCTVKHVHVWANSKWHGTTNHHMTSCLLELRNFHSILKLKHTPWNVPWNFTAIAVDRTVLDTLPDPEGQDLPNPPLFNATELWSELERGAHLDITSANGAMRYVSWLLYHH